LATLAIRVALALFCASCSVYDAKLLTSNNPDGLSGTDGSTDAADGSVLTDASELECSDAEFATCTRPNAETSCVDKACLIASCLGDFVDCDADAANGCEARLDSPEHCGLCGAACRFSNASGRCLRGACAFGSCNPDFADCDGDPENGCETPLDGLTNCGACGTICDGPTNGLAGCKDGRCGIESCIAPYGDCNIELADGCEQRLNTAKDCGACGSACVPANGEGTCDSGACVITSCQDGYVDCNGRAADGCETRVNSSDQCGGCGVSCELSHAEVVACEVADQGARCVVDHACAEGADDCEEGAPATGCADGYSDCDANPANGCETNLTRLSDCGACGNSCVKPNQTSECRDGMCHVTGCAPGFALCGSDACRSLAKDPAACGGCDTTCSGDKSQCAGGRCTGQTCEANRADCDGQQGNGCETDLTTTNNCGICGQRCALPHANAVCRSGGCAIGSCEAGWKDCDGDVSNGCEVDIRTANDCGDCDRPCVASNATTSCSTGTCRIDSCSEGRGDCNSNLADGCEADFGLPAACGGCDNACAQLPNVASSSCEDSVCNLVCLAGRADCDKRSRNGCEADLSNATSCGACGNDCTQLANVSSASCTEGSCKSLVCDQGFADCNGNPADGCERRLNTLTDCGGCGRSCAPAHATGTCESGACQVSSCDSGFDDCNDRGADGCETALSGRENCGACGNTCGGTVACTNGKCGCAADTECAAGSTCCNGSCAPTKTQCFPWPCVPGTDRTASAANCGGCNTPCLLWCCAIP
jgi:hypothetical protein